MVREGVLFITSGVNYKKQHSDNMTANKQFSRGTSLFRGTTHARFGSEVEWKASNLVALLPGERSVVIEISRLVPASVMAGTA